MTYTSLQASITLPMQDFRHTLMFLFLIAMNDIIWLSGVVLVYGMFYSFSFSIECSDFGNRPVSKKELFNLRHASARNAIERIFGVLKRRFRILLLAPEYSMDLQAKIPPALCAIHNFIRLHDPCEGSFESSDFIDRHQINDDLFRQPADNAHHNHDTRRDEIAETMWIDYQRILAERNNEFDLGLSTDSDSDFLASSDEDFQV